MATAIALYLDLMKKCLANTIYGEAEELVACEFPRSSGKRFIASLFAGKGITLARQRRLLDARSGGLDNNPRAHTMIGLARLDNIQHCVERVIAERIPGDLIETGVWRGGATAFMRAILKAHGVKDRMVWVADSFEGLPPPDLARYPQDEGDTHHQNRWLAITRTEVEETFRRYDLLDDQVRFLEGWFADTLPRAPIDRLAVMRLDADMYGSTMDALKSLYPRLSVGGYVIVDDWGLIPTCRQAVDDFRAAHGITERVMPVDGNAGYWRRER
jgi:O-methyltransferase